MISTVYRRYCRSSGYMSLEEFVEFMEDSAILNTHVPHDENDEPLTEFQAQLDPVRLLTTVPRNLGYSLYVINIHHSSIIWIIDWIIGMYPYVPYLEY